MRADCRRCIGEAETLIEQSKERWFEAEVNRITGEIALMTPEPDAAKTEAYFERALAVARAQNAKSCPGARSCRTWQIRQCLGTARGNQHGAALARSGKAG